MIGKEKVKLFTDGMTVYVENTKEFLKKLQDVSEFTTGLQHTQPFTKINCTSTKLCDANQKPEI